MGRQRQGPGQSLTRTDERLDPGDRGERHVPPGGRYLSSRRHGPYGSDPRTSVVDADCRCWDIPNLWVCDGSVFPTQPERHHLNHHHDSPDASEEDMKPVQWHQREEATEYRRNRRSAGSSSPVPRDGQPVRHSPRAADPRARKPFARTGSGTGRRGGGGGRFRRPG